MTGILPSRDSASSVMRDLGLPPGLDPMEAYARVVWSVLAEPGDGAAGAMIGRFGALEALRVATSESGDEWAEARARWMPRYRPSVVDAAIASARRSGAQLVVPTDPRWLRGLDDLGAHAPSVLWLRGRLDPRAGVRVVAIVGARAATPYGEAVAADLAADLAGAGVVVVSGAAYGIDGAAHRAALSADGQTIAFLAGGVDRPYPRGHDGLLTRIAATGAVLSETPCGAAPTKWRFLHRNRLIAAIADAVVVVEAGWRSGSLNTAAHAATLGRALGAVPGPVTSAASAGSHRILRELDSVCVTSAADVLEMLGAPDEGIGENAPDSRDAARTDDATRMLDALSSRVGRDATDVARRAGFSETEAQVLLGFAELEGRAVRDSDGRWRAKHGAS